HDLPRVARQREDQSADRKGSEPEEEKRPPPPRIGEPRDADRDEGGHELRDRHHARREEVGVVRLLNPETTAGEREQRGVPELEQRKARDESEKVTILRHVAVTGVALPRHAGA